MEQLEFEKGEVVQELEDTKQAAKIANDELTSASNKVRPPAYFAFFCACACRMAGASCMRWAVEWHTCTACVPRCRQVVTHVLPTHCHPPVHVLSVYCHPLTHVLPTYHHTLTHVPPYPYRPQLMDAQAVSLTIEARLKETQVDLHRTAGELERTAKLLAASEDALGFERAEIQRLYASMQVRGTERRYMWQYGTCGSTCGSIVLPRMRQ